MTLNSDIRLVASRPSNVARLLLLVLYITAGIDFVVVAAAAAAAAADSSASDGGVVHCSI